jgi:hypothetical protein
MYIVEYNNNLRNAFKTQFSLFPKTVNKLPTYTRVKKKSFKDYWYTKLIFRIGVKIYIQR